MHSFETGNVAFWNNSFLFPYLNYIIFPYYYFPYYIIFLAQQSNSNKVHFLSNNTCAEKIKFIPPNKIQMKCSTEVFLHLLITALCSYCQRPRFQEKESQSPCFVLVHFCSTTYSSLGEGNCKKHKWTRKQDKQWLQWMTWLNERRKLY